MELNQVGFAAYFGPGNGYVSRVVNHPQHPRILISEPPHAIDDDVPVFARTRLRDFRLIREVNVSHSMIVFLENLKSTGSLQNGHPSLRSQHIPLPDLPGGSCGTRVVIERLVLIVGLPEAGTVLAFDVMSGETDDDLTIGLCGSKVWNNDVF